MSQIVLPQRLDPIREYKNQIRENSSEESPIERIATLLPIIIGSAHLVNLLPNLTSRGILIAIATSACCGFFAFQYARKDDRFQSLPKTVGEMLEKTIERDIGPVVTVASGILAYLGADAAIETLRTHSLASRVGSVVIFSTLLLISGVTKKMNRLGRNTRAVLTYSASAFPLAFGAYIASYADARASTIGLLAIATAQYFKQPLIEFFKPIEVNLGKILVPYVSILTTIISVGPWGLQNTFGALTATIIGTTLLSGKIPIFHDPCLGKEGVRMEQNARKAFCSTILSQVPKDVEKNSAQNPEILFYQMIEELIKSPTEPSDDNLPEALRFSGKGCNLLSDIHRLRETFRSLKPEEQENFHVSNEEALVPGSLKNLWKDARNIAAFLYLQPEKIIPGSDALREGLSFKSSLEHFKQKL